MELEQSACGCCKDSASPSVPTPPPTETTPILPKTHKEPTPPAVSSAHEGVQNNDQANGKDSPDQVEETATSTVTKMVSV